MVGGISALTGAFVVGPRKGFFDGSLPKETFKGHNVPLVVLGTFILWFGWFGFNAGSTLGFSGDNVDLAAKVSVNTAIGGAVGGLVVFLINALIEKLFVSKEE